MDELRIRNLAEFDFGDIDYWYYSDTEFQQQGFSSAETFNLDNVDYPHCLVYTDIDYFTKEFKTKLVYSRQYGFIYILNNRGNEFKRVF